MEKDKNKEKIREPFPADHTPRPPQDMDPRTEPEQNEGAAEKKSSTGNRAEGKKEPADKAKSEKLLGESPLEIDDETTI